MRERVLPATDVHNAFKADLESLIRTKYADTDAYEILAVFSQFLGMLIALQDQTKRTSAAVMETVAKNIEIGNKLVLDDLKDATAAGSA